MSEYAVLMQVRLTERHRPSGKTRHYEGDVELPSPKLLKIVKYLDDDGYYLLYLAETGRELTDTYHDSIDGALAQAEWEFEVKPVEWERVAS